MSSGQQGESGWGLGVGCLAIIVVILGIALLIFGDNAAARGGGGAVALLVAFCVWWEVRLGAKRRRLLEEQMQERLEEEQMRERFLERQRRKRLLEEQERKQLEEEQKRQRIESLLRRDAVRDEINYMSGPEFERFMADVFRQKGYEVEETRLSGDQGVDLILPDLDGKRVVVQLKRWTPPVGNKAVQATFAGMAHYQAQEGWIITTSTFTKSARELARSTRVRLIDGKELGEWLEGLREEE